MTKKWKIILAVLVLFVLVLAVLGAIKLVGCEKVQDESISFLKTEVSNLWKKVNSLEDENTRLKQELSALNKQKTKTYSKGSFNYLAIGNSILVHETNEHWWNEIGMAASSVDKDYFHIVTSYLETIYGNVDSCAFCLPAWEMQYYDRSECLQLLDDYLSPNLDLVTVQLGDNANDELITYEDDFIELLEYIKDAAPKAQIIVVGDYFEADGRDEIKIRATEKCGADYADISSMRNNPEYLCGMGTTVYDAEGNPHEIDYIGIAMHPGDKGMLYIADAIIDCIK